VPNPPPAELQVDGETLHLAHTAQGALTTSACPLR
jgi:hypothetical protein